MSDAPLEQGGEAAASRRRGYLSLGSNIGDRRANLQRAVDGLLGRGVTVTASSSTYDTEPVGLVLDQPEFLNACVRVQTALEPEPLLDTVKQLERELGREQGGPRHGPRVIDIDILLLGDVEHHSERLDVPHRELANRRFVLVPLLELDPELRLPGDDGRALAEVLTQLGGAQEVRLAGPPLSLPI